MSYEIVGFIFKKVEPDTTSPMVGLQILAGIAGGIVFGALAWYAMTLLLLNFEMDPSALWWLTWGVTIVVGLISGILLGIYLVLCIIIVVIACSIWVGGWMLAGGYSKTHGYAILKADTKIYAKVEGKPIGTLSTGTCLKLCDIYGKKYTTWFAAYQLVDSMPKRVTFIVPEKTSRWESTSVFTFDSTSSMWLEFNRSVAKKNSRAESKIINAFIASIQPIIKSTADNLEKEKIELDKSKKILYRGFQGRFQSDKASTIYYCNAADYGKLRKLDRQCNKDIAKSKINPYRK
jgi:hypothetical protein